MARRQRRPVLDEIRRREILAILSVGCPRSTAARYVGCSPLTLLNTAARDPAFAEQLRHAEYRAEVECLRAIQEAARLPNQWRAAAWVLERKNPQAYVRRSPLVYPAAQVEQLFRQMGDCVCNELPDKDNETRRQLLRQLDQLILELRGPKRSRPESPQSDEPQSLDAQ